MINAHYGGPVELLIWL